jgi:hypothetical protein
MSEPSESQRSKVSAVQELVGPPKTSVSRKSAEIFLQKLFANSPPPDESFR